MSGSVEAVAIAVFVPVVTAAAGVASLLLQDWRVRRSRVGRHRLAYEEAARQVAFATDWWQAQQLIPATEQELRAANTVARGWLADASARVAELDLAQGAQEAQEQREFGGRLLLLYEFGNRPAKLIRAGFHASLVVLMLVSLGVSNAVLTSQPDLGWDLVILALCLLLSWALRFWAVAADAASRRDPAAGSSSVAGRAEFGPSGD